MVYLLLNICFILRNIVIIFGKHHDKNISMSSIFQTHNEDIENHITAKSYKTILGLS